MSDHASPVRSTRPRRLVSVLIALLLAFVCFLAGEWTLERFFNYNPDTVARDAEARSNPDVPSSKIVLVTITDSDYARLFGGRSPLRADSLERVIHVIADAKPRVIGVDLETADTSFARLASLAARTDGPRIVWAQDVGACPAIGTADEGDGRSSQKDACGDTVMALGVLGRSAGDLQGPTPATKDAIETGLAVTQLDEYGTVRHYQKSLMTPGGSRFSFATAIRRAYGTPASDDNDQTPRYVRFHKGPSTQWRLSVQQLLNLAGKKDALDSVIQGKIVLLGGTYRAARDEHHTPIGMMAGVDVHAQTIDTELDPRGNTVPSWLRLTTLRFVFGIVLAVPFFFLPLRRGLLLTLPIGIACCLVGSWMATDQWVAGVGYFLPFLLLVVIFALYERASHIQHEFYLEFRRRIGGREPDHDDSAAPIVDRLSSAVAAAEAFVVGRARSRIAALRRPMRPASKAPPDQPPSSTPNEGANPVTRS